MKRVLFTALLVLLFSCGNDDDVLNAPDDLAVKDFMWKAMNLWYFWQAEIPNLADNKFTTDELKKINACRIWLKVTMISEITNINGTHILTEVISDKNKRSNASLWKHSTSKFKWPKQPKPGP